MTKNCFFKKWGISVFMFLFVLNVSSMISLPQFSFQSSSVDCDGNYAARLTYCSELQPEIVNVTWNIQGNVVVTPGLSINYNFPNSGNYSISARVSYYWGNALQQSDVLVSCGNTYTSLNINVWVYEADIFTVDANGLGKTIFNQTDPIRIGVASSSFVPQLIYPYPSKLYVDGIDVTNSFAFPSSSVQYLTLTDPAFSTVGQHTVTLICTVKGFERNCPSIVTCNYEVVAQPSTCSGACFTFQPKPGERYWASAWVKVATPTAVPTYATVTGPFLQVSYTGDVSIVKLSPTGEIIDGWQRIAGEFTIPSTNPTDIKLSLVNGSSNVTYFDDVRVHPYNASMKSYVYDPSTYWLLAELDDNNYATIYEYDKEGQLIRIKKETERGIMTIQESRSKNPRTSN